MAFLLPRDIRHVIRPFPLSYTVFNVLFKSCFPNSDLYGRPDDAPTPGYDFTVGNARWVYNEILQYFATRPDKLFVVITAPPLSAPAIPENARAFNQWLVHDWLRENAYPYDNVAVFDFFNVLTGPDAHHRVVDGAIEHAAGLRVNWVRHAARRAESRRGVGG
ncbi:MAG: hypothetical protein KC425_17390 [Anaerolineales bacterium]|nr:hypothetical protein [Anaerolineales bacterium]